MARHHFLLTLAACTVFLSGATYGEETPTPTPAPSSTPPVDHPTRPKEGKDGKEIHDPRIKEMREIFEKMPPDLKQQLVDKFRKWQQMPGDEQAHFRFMQGEREKRAQQAVDESIQASGLKLDDAQKQKFTEIYKQERHKLEEGLRNEMDKRRQERLPDMQKAVVEAYQKEAAAPSPSVSPSPCVTPTATP